MQKISEIVSLTQFDKYKNASNVSAIDEEKTKKVLNRLFIRFERIFPKFWVNIKSQAHLNGIKDEWFECFQRAKIIDTNLFKVGLLKAQESNDEYLVKASKFIQWCTEVDPEDMGFPKTKYAYNVALKINEQFSNYTYEKPKVDAIIRHTIKQIGCILFRESFLEKSYEIFERYYEISCRQFIKGEFSDIAPGIEDRTTETQELSKQNGLIFDEYKKIKNPTSALDAMKKLLG